MSRRGGSGEDSAQLILRLSEGIPPTQIAKLIDRNATRENIRSAILELQKIPEDQADEVLVYLDLRSLMIPYGRERRPFLLPYDAQAADLTGTAIGAGDLSNWLQTLRVRKLIVLLHAGFVGPMFEKDRLVQMPGHVVLGAAYDRLIISPELENQSSFLFFANEALGTMSMKTPERSRSLLDIFTQTQYQVNSVSRGNQQPVVFGDKAAASAFLLPLESAREKMLQKLTTLVQNGRISQRTFIRASRSLIKGASESRDEEILRAVEQVDAKKITDEEFNERITSLEKVEK